MPLKDGIDVINSLTVVYFSDICCLFIECCAVCSLLVGKKGKVTPQILAGRFWLVFLYLFSLHFAITISSRMRDFEPSSFAALQVFFLFFNHNKNFLTVLNLWGVSKIAFTIHAMMACD